MKKIISVLFVICILSIALVSCGGNDEQPPAPEPEKTGSGISIDVLNITLSALMGDTTATFADNMDGTYVYEYYDKLKYVASVDENGEVTKIEFICTAGADVANIICSESSASNALSQPNSNRNNYTASLFLNSIITYVKLPGFSGNMTVNKEDVCKVFYSDANATFGNWTLSANRDSGSNTVVATLVFSK